MKQKKLTFIISLLIIGLVISTSTTFANNGIVNGDFKKITSEVIVSPTKTWVLQFNKSVAKASIEDSIYVVNEEKEKVETVVKKVADNRIIVEPPTEGYEAGNYFLVVTDNVTTQDGKKSLLNQIVKEFSVEEMPTYTVAVTSGLTAFDRMVDVQLDADKKEDYKVFVSINGVRTELKYNTRHSVFRGLVNFTDQDIKSYIEVVKLDK